jgi:hypothetical protein
MHVWQSLMQTNSLPNTQPGHVVVLSRQIKLSRPQPLAQFDCAGLQAGGAGLQAYGVLGFRPMVCWASGRPVLFIRPVD